MGSWISELRADSVAKDRLLYLRQSAMQAIKAASAVPGEGSPEGGRGLGEIVDGFRGQLHASSQIDEVCKLRVEYWRKQRHMETLHDWARRLLGGMVDNIESEINAIEQRTNFRIAVTTTLVAVLSSLLAFASLLVSLAALFFK